LFSKFDIFCVGAEGGDGELRLRGGYRRAVPGAEGSAAAGDGDGQNAGPVGPPKGLPLGAACRGPGRQHEGARLVS